MVHRPRSVGMTGWTWPVDEQLGQVGGYPFHLMVPPSSHGTPFLSWYPLSLMVPPSSHGTPFLSWYPLPLMVPPSSHGTPFLSWYPVGTFCTGSSGAGLFEGGIPNTAVLALCLQFSYSLLVASRIKTPRRPLEIQIREFT